MNFKEIVLPVLLVFLATVAVSCAITGIAVWDFSNECADNGGNFTIETTSAWCRY